MDGENSEDGLFSQLQGPLLPVVKCEWTGGTSERAHGVKILHEYLPDQFEREIISSDLLSRGWVHQEVLLTPANLFCTKEQMWWSCCATSCSQSLPRMLRDRTSPDDLDQFSDGVGLLKQGLLTTMTTTTTKTMTTEDSEIDPLKLWGDIVRHYSGTLVTLEKDRLVAIVGLAKLLASQHPKLRNAVCHSGVWSIDVLPQLLWRSNTSYWKDEILSLTKFSGTTHPIPSWSPFSCGSVRPGEIPLDRKTQYLSECLSMPTLELDQFWRARDQQDCVLHLRGVAVDISFDKEAKFFNASGHAALFEAGIRVHWDTVEDKRTALSSSGRLFAAHPIGGAALQEKEPNWSCAWTYIDGLVLRAVDQASHGSTRKQWVRCGFFRCDIHPGQERHFSDAFQIKRHGIELVLADFMDQDGDKRKCVNLEPTGEAPDLEDVYII